MNLEAHEITKINGSESNEPIIIPVRIDRSFPGTGTNQEPANSVSKTTASSASAPETTVPANSASEFAATTGI